ncbi:MAG: YebC/PmpR family DNA-binding transcriptional regulator [Candidatus Synoicihabitans palmerolidicus]|nr:YebC/PmpR family DNA-binding transcriptional regulator [Candidatus Synoicihabitans palmerolidicus]
MGRQWLHAKRAIVNNKKGQFVGKLVKELSVAAKLGGPDPDAHPRLFAAIEKARKASVTREVIERAVRKGAGIGGEKMIIDQVVFEGYAPHKVPLIVEAYTDNVQRTTPEIRVLFRKGSLGLAGSNKFLFDHVGIVEAAHPDSATDLEGAAIEAGANDFEALSSAQNDDIPEDQSGARFLAERTDTHAVATWLGQNGWSVVTAEIGYVAKMFPDLTDEQREEVGEFLQAIEDHDDVQRMWAAVR